MATATVQPKAEEMTKVRAACAWTCADKDVKEAVMKVEKAFHDAKATASARLEDARMRAERLGKRGRYAVEDGIIEATHRIQRHPFHAVAIAFAAGSFCGFLAPHLIGKKGNA
jgi:ElaB/YqjD/DUF883 family membrane-anchored ribosome-binding protein